MVQRSFIAAPLGVAAVRAAAAPAR